VAVDILFLSWNRAEFTEVALDCLVHNTNWRMVRRLVIYDDGSEPEQLGVISRCVPSPGDVAVPVDVRHTRRLGPPGVMLDYLRHDPAEVFVKIDNDIAVPELWLEDLSSAWGADIELLGMEVGHPHGFKPEGVIDYGRHVFVPARHIGGVGMMRAEAFLSRRSMRPDGRNGFTEWQHTHQPRRGWIFPEINAPCLDRLPIEPFVSLSKEYERRGWQRPWWKYPLDADRYWDWLAKGEVTA
jgi:hypothetical protein